MKKWKTREVMVGNVGVGKDNPIRIQSMTTSNTRDIEATVQQIIRLADYGCEIARITVQGKSEAEACAGIKNALIQKGYTIPIVADIHFYPKAAMQVVDFVDKVRINPGNFVDKRATFQVIEYDDAIYALELVKIEETFAPLVEKCIKLKKAMRIGTNHGSLSDRIMNRFGDTPAGMVESAFEFARVCRKYNYHDFIFSMKASNPLVMIEAYRLLVHEMIKLGWDYPIHLGVTEAGDGEDGRVKSAIGIGSLLLDGIGDTIRVSLTEDPWDEIDPCKRLVQLASHSFYKGLEPFKWEGKEKKKGTLLHPDGSVILSIESEDLLKDSFYVDLGCKVQLGQIEKGIGTVDAVYIKTIPNGICLQKLLKAGISILTSTRDVPGTILVKKLEEIQDDEPCIALVQGGDPFLWNKILTSTIPFILLQLDQERLFFDWMKNNDLKIPVILHREYTLDEKDTVIYAAAEMGSLLADQYGDGISLKTNMRLDQTRSLAFAILQGCRMRAAKTEFIACPGCGRTLFNLQQVTQRIRARTSHLPGVKIAIMGCIVNGPGEMADADFGYVGAGAGKINLYVGKTCVRKNIDSNEAEDHLIDLIKEHGKWIEADS